MCLKGATHHLFLDKGTGKDGIFSVFLASDFIAVCWRWGKKKKAWTKILEFTTLVILKVCFAQNQIIEAGDHFFMPHRERILNDTHSLYIPLPFPPLFTFKSWEIILAFWSSPEDSFLWINKRLVDKELTSIWKVRMAEELLQKHVNLLLHSHMPLKLFFHHFCQVQIASLDHHCFKILQLIPFLNNLNNSKEKWQMALAWS